MTTAITTPNVPLPAGALEVQDWHSDNGTTTRLFWGTDTDFEIEAHGHGSEYVPSAIVRVAGKHAQ